MAYHNKQTSAQFEVNIDQAEKLTEQELMDAVNETVKCVELDSSYTTKQKLKIYSVLTSLSNCSERERKKYAKRVKKLL